MIVMVFKLWYVVSINVMAVRPRSSSSFMLFEGASSSFMLFEGADLNEKFNFSENNHKKKVNFMEHN
jgi:hypothetical protein